jgi:hypothetical protein
MLLEAPVSGYASGAVSFRNTSVTTLHRTASEKWELVAANDVEHLEGLSSGIVREVETTDDSGN